VERAFRIFDRDGNGTVSMAEFIDTMHQFAGQSSDEKLVFLFKVYDLDGESDISQSVASGRSADELTSSQANRASTVFTVQYSVLARKVPISASAAAATAAFFSWIRFFYVGARVRRPSAPARLAGARGVRGGDRNRQGASPSPYSTRVELRV